MLYDILSSNYPISLVILALVGLWVYRQRSSIDLALRRDALPWRVVSWIAVGTTSLLFLWVTLFDNWRRLLGYIVFTGRDYATDLLSTEATPEGLRTVSLALLAVSVISLALVYARHMGSYAFLILTALFAPVFMFTFNEIRISSDVYLRLTEFSLTDANAVDVVSIVFWSMGMYVIIAAVVLAGFLTLLALAALPARIIYGLFVAPKHEELARVFESYERRARNSRTEQSRQSQNAGLPGDAPQKG